MHTQVTARPPPPTPAAPWLFLTHSGPGAKKGVSEVSEPNISQAPFLQRGDRNLNKEVVPFLSQIQTVPQPSLTPVDVSLLFVQNSEDRRGEVGPRWHP